MINTQLLDYIKKQLSAGVSREEIERTLVSGGGWAKSDVDEAFGGIVPPKPEMLTQNTPIGPYVETSQVVANNLSSQQNIVSLSQQNFGGNVLRSSIDLFGDAFSVYKNKFGSFLIALSPLLLSAILFLLIFSISADYVAFALPIVFLVSFILSSLGTSSILFIVANREKDLSFSEIMNGGFSKILSLIWLMLISSFIILGGSALFFIPGLIFSVWFSLSLSILFGEDKRGMDAMLQSKEYVKGYWGSVAWRLIAFGLIMFALSLIIFIPISLIGWALGISANALSYLFNILLTPLAFIYTYLLYENIKGLKSGVALQPGSKTPFIIVAILGGLFIPIMIFGMLAFGLFSLFKNADVQVDTFSNININTSDESGGAVNIPQGYEQAVNSTNDVADVSNWQTYANTKYDFSFKHPSDTRIGSNEFGGGDESLSSSIFVTNPDINNPNREALFSVEVFDPANVSDAYKNLSMMSLREFTDSVWNVNAGNVGEIHNSYINGANGYSFDVNGSLSYGKDLGGRLLFSDHKLVFLRKDNINYIINYLIEDQRSKDIYHSFSMTIND